MNHHPDCLAQNAATLFGETKCICSPTWLKRQAKAAKPARVPNPCHNAPLAPVVIPADHFGLRLPFKPSTKQLLAYAKAKKHKVPLKRKRKKGETADQAVSSETFDKKALRVLRAKYPADPIYNALTNFRILGRAKGTYLAAMTPTLPSGQRNTLFWADGRMHDVFRHAAKTMRLGMELFQVMPKALKPKEMAQLPPGDARRVYNEIRHCVVPRPGHAFLARDFKAIEPKLVAYCAKDAHMLRATNDMHSWFAAFVVGKPVDFSLSDTDITAYYSELAQTGPYTIGTGKGTRSLDWDVIRRACKTAGMASLYAGGPHEIWQTNPEVFGTKAEAAYYQDAFFDLASSVRRWHRQQAEDAQRDTYLMTPLGIKLHYFELFKWAHKDGKWTSELSEEAKKAIAAVPQHCGMMYLAMAAVALAERYPHLTQWLRLLIHDEIFTEVPVGIVEELDHAMRCVMEEPHPLMPLWPEAVTMMGMTHLSVKTDVKVSSTSWGDMK